MGTTQAGIARDDPTKYSSQGQPDMKPASAISSHLLQTEFSNWASTFETNVTAQYFTSVAFLPLLSLGNENTKGYSSSIVNVASISGVMKGSSGGQFAYAASKAAFLHLTRMLATTLTETKIRVNCIAPGLFPSEMTTGKSDDMQKSEIDKELSNPAGRPGNDSDMAACILYLAGPGGLFLNSQVLYPDGGNVLVQPAAV
jgi:NAD(P)-dependent dehydrogenase (short-subunit alcohol dehydrogenase family)